MADNRYIVVEGVIGAGKTSLARLLTEHLLAKLVLEEVEENPFLKDFYRDLENRSIAKLTRLEERCREKGAARVFHDLQYGKRAEAIVHYAEERGMDLIVLSSHKVDRDHPALGWGTSSYRVAIVARCPVLLVK